MALTWRTRYIFLLPLIFLLPFFLSVYELHQKPRQQEQKRNFPLKSDHLILGPAAGQGLPNRLQCEGLKAMNQIILPSSQKNLDINEKVSFVSVFTLYNSSNRSELESINDNLDSKVIVGSTSCTKTERSIAILKTFINFIQVSMPRSCVFLLTDPAAKLTIDRKNVTIFPILGDYARGQLMLQRIRSYIAFLESRLQQKYEMQNFVNHYIFTDSDVAIVDDLGHLFQNYPDFHLALTFRNNKGQPLNSGFIAVRGTPDGIRKSKIFLEEVLEIYSSKYINASRMLGDQLALAWVVRSHLLFTTKHFRKSEAFSAEINGASILFLPCAIFNWTPPEGAGQFHGMPLDVKAYKVAWEGCQLPKSWRPSLTFLLSTTWSNGALLNHHGWLLPIIGAPPPPPGWLKANVDGSLLNSNKASVGVYIRDDRGNLCVAAGRNFIHWDIH